MTNIILVISLITNLVILFILLSRKNEIDANLIRESSEKITRSLHEEMSINRNDNSLSAKEAREELAKTIKNFGDSVDRRVFTLTEGQNKNFSLFSDKLGEVIDRNDKKIEYMRTTIEKRLENIQRDNGEKLEKMRETVDEKLHATLEKRLSESFKLVSDRLEQVHKGLGEMQTLATGVGDLKKVLQNVKTRGTWGEVQLNTLLDQIMSIEQYEKNVATKKGSNDRVEFAIKIPAKDDKIKNLWLPIDAKFPLEDFQNLIDAEEKNDTASVLILGKALENRIKSEAKDIREKYLDPPYTTDFGILFLPIESLYAEILRRPGLADTLQRDYKVIITGPTTIAAILNSLQMGFRTLAIEKRSGEVWTLLGSIKKEFTTFGDILEKTNKKLREASDNIDLATKKSRTIEKKLNKVQELPAPEIIKDLPLGIES
jgi:DNA recombination protein RmuC